MGDKRSVFTWWAGLTIAGIGLGCGTPDQQQPTEPGAAPAAPVAPIVAFVDVNVVPMSSDQVLEHQSVVVKEGRVSAMGPEGSVEIPEGAQRIDGTGHFLMPGLTEMHGHLPSPDMPAELTDNVLFLYVANGVTTVRGMQGNASQVALRQRIRTGELVGPQLLLGSPSMTGNRVTSAAQAEALVREYDEAGFDLLKVHEGLSREVHDTIATTALELGMPFAGHVSDHVGLFRALEVGQSTIDHLDNYVEALVPEDRRLDEPPGLRGAHELLARIDESRMGLLVEKTLEADGSVVPTMVLWESGIYATRPSEELVEQRPEVAFVPKEMVERWARAVDERVSDADPEAMMQLAALRRRILSALYEGGVRILLGTDSPQIFSVPGFSIHREMQFYVEVGMTPYDVLSSGTRVVGEFLEADFGTVAVGQRADLLLLEANPLEDVANVSRRVGVMVNGAFIPEAAIQERLTRIAAGYEN